MDCALASRAFGRPSTISPKALSGIEWAGEALSDLDELQDND